MYLFHHQFIQSFTHLFITYHLYSISFIPNIFSTANTPFKWIRRQTLVLTPFSQLHNLMRLCSSYAIHEENGNSIHWLPDKYGRVLLIGGEEVSLLKLQLAVQRLTSAAVTVLENELLFGVSFREVSEALPLNRFQDRRLREDPSYSFLQEQGIKIIQERLVARLELSPVFTDRYVIRGTDGLTLSAPRMRLYLREAWRFLEIMLTLIHLCSGQPARATEIETMTIRNGPNTARSVFLFQEHIMTVIAYNKTTSLTGHERFIARFLPKAQSKTLAVYLVVVRYFER